MMSSFTREYCDWYELLQIQYIAEWKEILHSPGLL